MQELRFVAVSEDGRYAVLGIPGRSARFTLPIDERLRAVALGQTSRLAQYEIEVESPLRPKEIQARIRAGETVDEIADAAGIAVERVRWFEGPVLAERAYVAQQAQTASVRRPGDPNPGPRLGEIVTERLEAVGSDPEDAQWDAKKRGDGSWLVQLTFTSGGLVRAAEWVFDPRRRHVMPADDNAGRMSLPGAEPPQLAPSAEATVTHLAPRLNTASGHGAGPSAPPVPAPQRGQLPRTAVQDASDHAAAAARPAASPPPRPAASARPAGPARPVAPAASPARDPKPAPAAPAPAAPAPAASVPPAAAPPAAAPPSAPAAAQPAASAGSNGEQPGRQGTGARKGTRGRRSSVPSWDEIMFGNSRQRD
jgi:Protein of unknown function (DUF3071)